MKGKKYLWISFVLTLLFSMFMVNVPLPASPTVTYSIDPSVTAGVPADSIVKVNVTINTPVNITGFRIWIQIDPAVLSPGAYVEVFPGYWMWFYVTEGNFLSDWATAYNWTPGIVPIAYTVETDGYSDISLYIKTWQQLPAGHGASGTGTLVTLWFTSQNETAYSRIDITQAQYTTRDAEDPIDVDVLNDGHYNEPVGGDVAVTNVVPTNTQVYPTWSDPLDINVTVENVGATTATFTVSAYYENVTAAYAIGTLPVTGLAPGATENLTFSWDLDLSGVDLGLYTIKANATLEGDINLANNEFVDGTVKVKMSGDTDGDGDVDLDDVFVLAAAYLAIYPDPRYNPAADFDGDLDVDLDDVFCLAANYLKSTDKY